MKEFEIYSFKSSFDRFNHLEIDDIFKFHIIFDDLKLNDKHNDIFMAIKTEILYKFKEISKRFEFDSDTKKALIKLAKSDRKKFGVNKILPRYKAQKIINELLETGFLELELSREKKPTPLRKNEKLPKHLRRYVVHNKINFKSHFARFWFRFIEPNLKLLEAKEFEAVLEKIKHNFDNYSSLGFEMLSYELLSKKLNLNLNEIYSFWTNELEIDVFAKFNDKFIVGEVKYKDRKICKNILNLINIKCQKLGISPDIIALFSKSGFSKELLNLKSENLLLFDLNDFKSLID